RARRRRGRRLRRPVPDRFRGAALRRRRRHAVPRPRPPDGGHPMTTRLLPLALAALLLAPLAHAQKHDHAHHRRAESVPHRADDAPTGLSPDDVTGLLEGAGMGLARPAEMNSYPGPMHVLELADALDLTPEQRATAERLMHEVKGEARVLGAQIVERERHLDQLFADGEATPEMVDRITSH